MAKFSQGKHAKAMCDRCGDKVDYKELKAEWTGLRVCKPCWDPKTKQEFPTNFPTDAESLKQPRPDNDIEASDGTAVSDMTWDPKLNFGLGGLNYEALDVFHVYPDADACDVNKKSDYFITAIARNVMKVKRENPELAKFLKPDLLDIMSGVRTM